MNRRWGVALAAAAGVLTADLLTKRWASATFTSEPVEVLGSFLRFRFVENTGAAFSMLQGAGTFLSLAAMAAIVLLVWMAGNARTGWEVTAYGLIMGGAAGNLVDRLARGEGWFDGPVIDWIDLWFIPTFNVADASITVAVALLIIGAWMSR